MKRILIALSVLLGTAYATNAQVVDFTGIDIQSESVKVIDVTTRKTGLVMGLGLGFQPISFSSEAYTAPAFKFDMKGVAWQATPQFRWDILDVQFLMGDLSAVDYGWEFTYFFSPKYKSFYASVKLGYILGTDEAKITSGTSTKEKRLSLDGFRTGANVGYAWRSFMLEANLDLYSNKTQPYGEKSRSGVSTAIGIKCVYFVTIPF